MFLNIILVNLRNKSKKHDIDATAQFAIETRRPLKTGGGPCNNVEHATSSRVVDDTRAPITQLAPAAVAQMAGDWRQLITPGHRSADRSLGGRPAHCDHFFFALDQIHLLT